MRKAKRTCPPINGYHNENYILPLTDPLARQLGQEPGTSVIVRIPHQKVLPVVIRTWESEPEILRAIKGRLPNIPECLYAERDFAIHSCVQGVPLSSLGPGDKPVAPPLVDALTRLLAQMAHVGRDALPSLPGRWPDDGDTQGFLKSLAYTADVQIRCRNRARFSRLFADLGVPEDALPRFAENVPAMAWRPFSLLHADLHRDNVIVTYGSRRPPLICIDWELATYGDPLHDLAIHLVRMRYPAGQLAKVVHAWARAMRTERPEAVAGVEKDLRHYVDFERAQSVYPDVMRAAKSLAGSFDQKDLDEATASVEGALESAARPLGLKSVPSRSAIERALTRWRDSRPGRRNGTRLLHVARKFVYQPDRRVPEDPAFPRGAVGAALVLEGMAPKERVFKGTSHVNTVVRVPGTVSPVMVRRKLPGAGRPERSYLSEHAVLRAIRESGVAVPVPRVLAMGRGRRGGPFVIHTYEGPQDMSPPRHPVHGLSPYEADALVDQLVAMTQVDWIAIDPTEGRENFYPWLRDQLVESVRNLPKDTQRLAHILGLPDADRLREMLSGYLVTPRRPTLLHGSLNPWNLVRRSGPLALTIIDWDMALVGDPLYDLARHMHLTPTNPDLRRRMLARWVRGMGDAACRNVYEECEIYRRLELVRSAYVDLACLMSGTGRHAPNVRRAVAGYGTTLTTALGTLGLPEPRTARVNPYLTLALS